MIYRSHRDQGRMPSVSDQKLHIPYSRFVISNICNTIKTF